MKNSITVVFFSGSGGVRKIASEFEKQFQQNTLPVSLFELDFSLNTYSFDSINQSISESQYLYVLFPVHAFDAPDIVYTWINEIKTDHPVNTVIISVSGGGEVWPNIGTRINCIQALEKKGFHIIYEKMMIMPSNWVFAVNDHLAMHILNSIPQKVHQIIEDVKAGKELRSHLKRKPLFQTILTRLEKWGARTFAKSFKITDSCNGCKICMNRCPIRNIKMNQNKPVFSDLCIMCFRCIYACPRKAIQSKNFMVLKTGYNLSDLEKRMKGVELEPVEICCEKGFLWEGVRDYLMS